MQQELRAQATPIKCCSSSCRRLDHREQLLPVIHWNLFVFAKIQVGINTSSKLNKRNGRKSWSQRQRRNSINFGAFWCNLASHTVGGATQWNTMAFCGTFKIPCPIDEHRMRRDSSDRSTARSYRSEENCFHKPISPEDEHHLFQFGNKVLSGTVSEDTPCVRAVDGQETCTLRTGTTSQRTSHQQFT